LSESDPAQQVLVSRITAQRVEAGHIQHKKKEINHGHEEQEPRREGFDEERRQSRQAEFRGIFWVNHWVRTSSIRNEQLMVKPLIPAIVLKVGKIPDCESTIIVNGRLFSGERDRALLIDS
jgi:hypothetical protein